jgi:transketolase
VLVLFHVYNIIYNKKDCITETQATEIKEEVKNPRAVQNEKDKRVQRNYQKMLIEYKKELSPAEYKKFQEETKYDILLYDALMVNRDKKGTLLREIEQEKGAHYASMLRKILD